ncbi:MAG: helix-turn-helix transcriptional regulator [Thermoleophilaceae bacterium]|nr:helix-turn-helix transcriptional regulator [Thermoleophilaceae bacterium]
MPSKRPDTRSEHRYVYETAVAFIATHHADALTLDDVARHAMTSTRQLQRVLRDEGTTFRGLLLRARMAQAVKLLLTGKPIGETAEAVGYQETAQFSRAFRSYFGCTPSACRTGGRLECSQSARVPAVPAT